MIKGPNLRVSLEMGRPCDFFSIRTGLQRLTGRILHLFDQKKQQNGWRPIRTSQRGKIEAQLKDFQLKTPNVSRLRILLCGQVGAGKSSFINSVNSVFAHRVTQRAGEAPCSGKSYTHKYITYTINKGTLPFVFNDVMGLEQDGILIEDINSAMLGHVKEGYTFNPQTPLAETDDNYIKHPSLDDKVHCLVSVVPANVISQMDESVIKKMNTVSQRANDIGIPHLVLMTKVDEACPLVKEDLKKIYTSKKIKEKMVECSYKVEASLKCIFPVKNYSEESDTNDTVDNIIMSAVEHIVNAACDFVSYL
ncbi:interferon-induced protein 44-like [Brachyhypopomus gauderio]|uniref:interferon-induced protein 44-like n=1 Tax=Brachyhypopomus gauderio TaxID=698409 RepID=UPI00404277D0